MRKILLGVGVAAMVAGGWGLGAPGVRAAADDEAAKPEFYTTKVKPIFEANCYRCHAGMNHRGGLTLSTKAGMMKGGKDGTVLVPGDSSASLLVKLIRHAGPVNDPKPMPPKAKLTDADVATVERWVRAGAVMPEDAPPQ
ncbi:c-type cytochrome domain-containing protein [Edaphobacter aggregans]|uniref:c-type cytochrome domain-containing protein n=1 Tax=Edaphobacter aggregans TaxID=570835 RepID=UPI000556D893|nr:c-type cytochrome domain-containing protein [Edaphobacter aggregans]